MPCRRNETDRSQVYFFTHSSLMRDVRKGKVALRFTAVDDRLRSRSGLMAWLPVRTSTGAGMLSLTSQAITRFSTLCVCSSTGASTYKPQIRKVIRTVAHVMSIDAAENEVVASELMRRPAFETIRPHTATCCHQSR